MSRYPRNWAGLTGRQLSLNGIEPPPFSIDPLFFAIYVETPAAAKMMQVAKRFKDKGGLKCKLMEPERLHVSLYSLGNYYGPRHPVLVRASEAAAAVRFTPFKVKFDEVITFRGSPDNRPIVLCGDAGADALVEFRNVLGTSMIRAGLNQRVSRSFTPHATLLYATGEIPRESVESIEWTVREFALVCSLYGLTQHVAIARWKLNGERIYPESSRKGHLN